MREKILETFNGDKKAVVENVLNFAIETPYGDKLECDSILEIDNKRYIIGIVLTPGDINYDDVFNQIVECVEEQVA